MSKGVLIDPKALAAQAEAGATLAEAAEALGAAYGSVCRAARRWRIAFRSGKAGVERPRPPTVADEAWARQARLRRSASEAARELGVSEAAARDAARRLGLTFRDGRKALTAADLGIPISAPRPAPPPPAPAAGEPSARRRRCRAAGCGCALSSYNPGPLCAPCARREAFASEPRPASEARR